MTGKKILHIHGIRFESLPETIIMTPSEKQTPLQSEQPFKTDAEKLVFEHLSDPNHVITEEDMRKIRIGVTPPVDESTEEVIVEAEGKADDQQSGNEE